MTIASPELLSINSFEINFKFSFSNYIKLIELSYGLTVTWALNPTILLINSVLKPFITDITIIKTATPKLIPINEKIEIIFKKPSFFLVFRYRSVISFSNAEISFLIFVQLKIELFDL